MDLINELIQNDDRIKKQCESHILMWAIYNNKDDINNMNMDYFCSCFGSIYIHEIPHV